MNLHQKLIEIRKSVDYLEKENKGFNYKYVSSSQTLMSVRQKMDDLGVLLVPNVKNHSVLQYKDKKDGDQFLTEIDLEYHWINAEDPTQILIVPWYAQGSDNAEKGVGKAYTYGEKYLILKFFNIATDKDDPDAHQKRKAEAGKQSKGQPGGFQHPEGASPIPETTSNPYIGKVNSVRFESEGTHQGKTWKLNIICTPEGDFATFDTSIAEIAGHAAVNGDTVQIVWKEKRRKDGTIGWIAEGMAILDIDDDFQRRVDNGAAQ
jgi:hypothetical protein